MGFLRYIYQIFESEKDQEIQIGYPTDVKHVAHIGWDGPSVNSPSWMKEFKSSSGLSTQPLTGDTTKNQINSSVTWAPEDKSRKRSTNAPKKREVPDMPKTSAPRRQSTGTITHSTAKEKSEKHKHPRKSSKPIKDSSDGSKSTPVSMDLVPSDSPTRSPSDIPKRSRQKKSKDVDRLRLKAPATAPNSDVGSLPGPSSKFRKSFDDDGGTGSEKSLVD